jgi:Flp pilus assembly protein TadD
MVSAAHAAGAPTFAHDIAPIVYRSCAPCHRPGEAGPFPLLSYSDVKRRAALIETVIERHYMPPWLPEKGYGEFQDERRLSAAEIRTIAEWVKAGTPQGPAAETPAPPHFVQGWQLGKPDLVLEAGGSFTLPASGPDVYWNFVFTPHLAQRRYVRAIEIRPGERGLVHHANLLIDRMGMAHHDEIAPGKGFGGMDLEIMRSPFDPNGHFLFWKPGGVPYQQPAGFAWRLDPGNELVLNTHLQPSGKPEEVQPTIGLYFTDDPPTRFPLLVQLENDAALDIPGGAKDFLVSDDFTLPMDADVLAVYPHAHYLGKLLEGYATLPSGERKWLIRIPDWDSNWQAVYHYREPVFLPKGSVISMRYHYDNSAANVRNPSQPPRRVRAGNQATDEMSHLWLQVLPRGNGDRRRELQEAVFRHRLDRNPDDFEARFNLGAVLLSRLQTAEAVSMLREAVRLRPGSAESRNMLGAALEGLGLTAEALPQYEESVRLVPDFTAARLDLARAQVKSALYAEAVENFRAVNKVYPLDEHGRQGLAAALSGQGETLAQAGRRQEAVECLTEAVSLEPKSAGLRTRLGTQLMLQSRFPEALEQFEKALALDATDDEARDKAEMVRNVLKRSGPSPLLH